jgi:ABC-type uncharacterized transport system substrate-binding protein
MKKRNENLSSMQAEVWKMKDRVYEETKNMNSREFFNYIKKKSKKVKVEHKNPATFSYRQARTL